jgi:hypothetical protein
VASFFESFRACFVKTSVQPTTEAFSSIFQLAFEGRV